MDGLSPAWKLAGNAQNLSKVGILVYPRCSRRCIGTLGAFARARKANWWTRLELAGGARITSGSHVIRAGSGEEYWPRDLPEGGRRTLSNDQAPSRCHTPSQGSISPATTRSIGWGLSLAVLSRPALP